MPTKDDINYIITTWKKAKKINKEGKKESENIKKEKLI